ncbi:NAD(P)H-hydrate dehydratase [Halalkalibacillus sediminis]|uniref:ADP-dependent (S)-NAD(P)H-hydrate dehydratase n=1 Tax=Halalkalibacillus sediminis TaxID=2018042 RepID=A0A2I0QYL1_9BACI|nr:NAD(P)H-hydrate dehydratase [Halalkalibacillus sediminis]PKR79399.1 NAD(P)H-hydrate dehydratase [Halalkalibacillus sediminis]
MSVSEWTKNDVRNSLPDRAAESHKGTFGIALLVAGSEDMPGAAILSGLGAMRSGLGKLAIATDEAVVSHIVSTLPEATYVRNGRYLLSKNEMELSQYRSIAVGPGLPEDGETRAAVERLLKAEVPVVLDAGAIGGRSYEERNSPTILTPHPGEFARMTGKSIGEIENNRASLVSEWAQRLGVTIVLKGYNTLTSFADGSVYKNSTGNSSLAKGGSGDVLTGMILGMLCCNKSWKYAVLNAIYLHGACADYWVKKRSAHSLLAHEISELLPEVWADVETSQS